MSSSTSSSDRRLRLRRALIACATAFVLSVPVGALLVQSVAALRYARPVPAAEGLPAGDWYVENGWGREIVSHAILYYGFGRSIENARDADLLLLGSSRVLAGFAPDLLVPFAETHGFQVFNLGFGHVESDLFPGIVIERHDLRPAMVVVDADGFFTNRMSLKARSIHTGSWFGDLRARVEATGAYLHRQLMWSWLPHFLPEIPIPVEWWEIEKRGRFRSSDHGFYCVWDEAEDAQRVNEDGGWQEIDKPTLRATEAFLERMRARDITVVLTHVPSSKPLGSRARAAALAERFGLAFVAPLPDQLVTSDGSHLTRASARRFSQAFITELEQHPVFDTLAAGDEPLRDR